MEARSTDNVACLLALIRLYLVQLINCGLIIQAYLFINHYKYILSCNSFLYFNSLKPRMGKKLSDIRPFHIRDTEFNVTL